MCSRFVFFVGSIVRSHSQRLCVLFAVLPFENIENIAKKTQTVLRKLTELRMGNFFSRLFFVPFFENYINIGYVCSSVLKSSIALSRNEECAMPSFCNRTTHRQRNSGSTTSSFALGYIYTAADDGHVMSWVAHIYQKSNTVNHVFFLLFYSFCTKFEKSINHHRSDKWELNRLWKSEQQQNWIISRRSYSKLCASINPKVCKRG